MAEFNLMSWLITNALITLASGLLLLFLVYALPSRKESHRGTILFLSLIRWPSIVLVLLTWFYLSIDLAPLDFLADRNYPEMYKKLKFYREVMLEALWVSSMAWCCLYVLKQWDQLLDSQLQASDKNEWLTSFRYIVLFLKGLVFVLLTLTLLRIFDLGSLADNIFTTGALSTVLIGLAARDALANIFGGFLVVFDRPFTVGDFIRSSDKDIEGTVERIGWRVTEVRTLQRRLKYIPNSAFSTISLENVSRMVNRLISFRFGVRYQDYKKVKNICEKIEAYCMDWDLIDKRLGNFVALENFGSSSLDIKIHMFTKPVSFREYHRGLEALLHEIVKVVHKSGADFPYPTTTLDAEGLVAYLKAGGGLMDSDLPESK